MRLTLRLNAYTKTINSGYDIDRNYGGDSRVLIGVDYDMGHVFFSKKDIFISRITDLNLYNGVPNNYLLLLSCYLNILYQYVYQINNTVFHNDTCYFNDGEVEFIPKIPIRWKGGFNVLTSLYSYPSLSLYLAEPSPISAPVKPVIEYQRIFSNSFFERPVRAEKKKFPDRVRGTHKEYKYVRVNPDGYWYYGSFSHARDAVRPKLKRKFKSPIDKDFSPFIISYKKLFFFWWLLNESKQFTTTYSVYRNGEGVLIDLTKYQIQLLAATT